MNIRLDKYLADSGNGTRSEVKLLIRSGSVLVNGKIEKDPGRKINNDKDKVSCKGVDTSFEEFEYFVLNKPAGVVTATRDKLAGTVMDIIKTSKRRDLFPVGRLDKDTEGLLLITNDGQLSHRLLAPGKHVDKGYLAMVSGVLPSDAAELFERGVDIGDEEPTAPAILKAVLENDPLDTYFDGREIPGTVKVHIVITEGRYHQIKRMFEALGCRVEYLKRISMGSLVLDKDLGVGDYRELNPGELEDLGIKCYYSQ